MKANGSSSPTIHRCDRCGGLVHPSDRSSLAAWCRRCDRMVGATVDGGIA